MIPELRIPLRRLAAALLPLALALPGSAQAPPPGLVVPEDTATVQILSLADGSSLFGRILEVGPPVRFRLTSGQVLTLEWEAVREVKVSNGRVVNGQVWEPDPNPTRLFFAPTARTTPRGSGYFSVYELVIPFLSFSLTDAFMLAGGTPIIGGFDGSRPFWIAPKLRVVNTPKVQAALGIWSISTGDLDDELFSLLYGVGTFGDADLAFTVAIGYGMEGSDLADSPVLVGGFETRVARRMKLVSENWIFPGDVALLSIGPRFMGERLSADVGLGWLVGDGEAFLFPLVNFVFSW